MATTPKKALSKNEIANLSPLEFVRVSSAAYKKLLPWLKPYKWLFIAGLAFGFLYGAAQGLLILVIKHVGKVVFPEHPAGSHASTLWVTLLICMAIPAIMAMRGACSYLNSFFMLKVSIYVLNDVRNLVFSKLMEKSMNFFNTAKSGELIQVVFGRTRMAQTALTQVASDIIKQPISVISALAALIYVDWKFTLFSLVLFPLCMLPVMIVSRRVRKSGEEEEVEASGLMVLMQEAFAGIRLVKSFGREGYEARRFDRASKKTLRNMMRWRAAMELVGPLVEVIASFGVSGALLYAWYFDLGAAKFIALNGGLLLLYPPFKVLSRLHILLQKSTAATGRVFEIIEEQPDIVDAPDAKALEHCKGHIRFEEAYFKYLMRSGKQKPAIKLVSIDIPPGTTCALVGSSGAGKSTMMSLLLRLYDVSHGRILIDGQDIRSLTQQSLRDNIGIVTQETFLFHDTIRANIRYGRLDATDEEIEQAAKMAHIHNFIIKLRDGYNSIVGDKGCMLSGGQQQRIAIARAVLKDAPILLLDEATSALDSESEKHIQAALENLSQGRTVVVIAHRLSTILKADQIVVMEHGKVKEVGTHAELYGKSGVYRKLYDLQFHAHQPHPKSGAAASAAVGAESSL